MNHYLPYGKYKGKTPQDVPSDYLQWFLRETHPSTGLRAAVCDVLHSRGLSTPPGPAPTPPACCPRCGDCHFLAFWHELRDGDRRIRAECRQCRKFLKFLAHTPEFMQMADVNEPTAGLLDLLTQCDERGVRLVSDGERIDFAPGDWHKATPEMRTLVKRYTHQLAKLVGKRTV
jgi:uncharacterized protein (DUF3820 family)